MNRKKVSLIIFIVGIILLFLSIKQSLNSLIDRKLEKTSKEVHLIKNMIEATNDITKLRKATGNLRLSQKISFVILKRLTK